MVVRCVVGACLGTLLYSDQCTLQLLFVTSIADGDGSTMTAAFSSSGWCCRTSPLTILVFQLLACGGISGDAMSSRMRICNPSEPPLKRRFFVCFSVSFLFRGRQQRPSRAASLLERVLTPRAALIAGAAAAADTWRPSRAKQHLLLLHTAESTVLMATPLICQTSLFLQYRPQAVAQPCLAAAALAANGQVHKPSDSATQPPCLTLQERQQRQGDGRRPSRSEQRLCML